MNIPFNGHYTYKRLVKYFKHQVFYQIHVTGSSKSATWSVSPCILKMTTVTPINQILVQRFNENWKLTQVSHYTSWDCLFFTQEEAQKEAKYRNDLYKNFDKPPFVTCDLLKAHKRDLINIQKSIYNKLKDYNNFDGIDFMDVSAGGIQIRGHHKQITGYAYGDQITIKYDFSNKDEVITQFVNMWKSQDTTENVINYQNFLLQGEKYGWD